MDFFLKPLKSLDNHFIIPSSSTDCSFLPSLWGFCILCLLYTVCFTDFKARNGGMGALLRGACGTVMCSVTVCVRSG